MATEVWFRNPRLYWRELAEVGVSRIIWDVGSLEIDKIDPHTHARLHFSHVHDFKFIVIGDSTQGAALHTPETNIVKPVAVWPVWEYGQDASLLEELLENPVGADPEFCSPKHHSSREWVPTLGQEHRVFITNLPNASTTVGRRFITYLSELQEEYPEAIIHPHGLYSFRLLFGLKFRSVDFEARNPASMGQVCLPSGKKVNYEKAPEFWIKAIGYRPEDMKTPRVRCMYNITSALWAGENWEKEVGFRIYRRTGTEVDPDAPVHVPLPASGTKSSKAVATIPGDKLTCDTCSIADVCRSYRAGEVCSIPGSDGSKLSQFFKTRNSDEIIKGLGVLMDKQAQRLERGMEAEEFDGVLDPEVTKIINSMVGNGVKLAKLVNPALAAAGAPKIQAIQINGAQPGGSPAQQLASQAIAELERQGIPRSQITPEMIARVLDPDAQPELPAVGKGVIDAEVVEDDDDTEPE